MQYRLGNCMIQSVEVSGTRGENVPTEDVEIAFGKIEWRYILQSRAGGGPAGNVASGWSLERNCRI